jgi:hypothetical protein
MKRMAFLPVSAVPSGLDRQSTRFPTLKRWAIIACPSRRAVAPSQRAGTRPWSGSAKFPKVIGLKWLASGSKCSHLEYMKIMVVPLRIPSQLYRKVQSEAKRRDKKVSELLRETIRYGLSALPALPDTSALVLDTWEKLGPAPEIDYDKL